MRLRIISGELKGRYIHVSEGNKPFRPTQERVRQAIAEKLKNEIVNAVCADVCAGSGAIGFEFISRGALKVDFIEKDRIRAQKIKESSKILNCSQQCHIVSREIKFFLRTVRSKYDIIYFDPPYDNQLESQGLIPEFIRLLTPCGVLLYERRTENKTTSIPEIHILPTEIREYGGTTVEFYCNTIINKGEK